MLGRAVSSLHYITARESIFEYLSCILKHVTFEKRASVGICDNGCTDLPSNTPELG
jgi:hypothetical protein